MLKRVHIKNYRSCRDVEISDMGPVLALVGRNGAGKTNILQAISWAARAATSTQAPSVDFPPSDLPTGATLEIALAAFACRYSIERIPLLAADGTTSRQAILKETLSVWKRDDAQWSDTIRRDGEVVEFTGVAEPLRIGAASPCLPALLALFPDAHPSLSVIRQVFDFLVSVGYYSLDESSDSDDSLATKKIVTADSYAKWLTHYTNQRDAGRSVVLRILHMFLQKHDQFVELAEMLGENGLGVVEKIEISEHDLSLHAEPSGKEIRFYVVEFVPGETLGADEQSFAYEQLSSGTRRIVRLLASMIFDGRTVLLVEHPEDGIHPGLMRKLIGLLSANADPAQIILASHSPEVFNGLSPEDVRLVTMANGETEVRALTPDEITAASNYMTHDGAFSEFLETVQEG